MSEVVQIPVDDLTPYVNNARTHSSAQVGQIAASIKEFGFTNPILTDGDNGIIAGHGRLLAAQKLGLDTVPTIELSHFTEAQKKAYIIADNKLALNAGWDDELLKLELDEIANSDINLELTGFSLDEVGDLLLEPDFAPGSEEDQGQLDQLSPKWVCCPSCGKEFDSREQE